MTWTRNEYVENFEIIENCSYLIPAEHIVWNTDYLANISFPPIEIQNLTKDMINAKAEFFFYLNSCIKRYWRYYYQSIFGCDKVSAYQSINIPTYSGSGIILNLLNIMKTSSEDGRQIGRKVLEKVKSMIAFRSYGSFDFNMSFQEKLSSKIKSKITLNCLICAR